ncbi:MAG: NAD-binding protein, partial [Phycisphaeraceae bacterium]|nr:NAD-binding protein [Phycisphaeraceae bacterium]
VGLCLAQVGEFSFVIADVAYLGKVINEHTFRLFVSATVVTLMMTPYLVATAPAAGRWCERLVRRRGRVPADDEEAHAEPVHRDHVIVVGFGPAGRRAAEVLRRRDLAVLVIDLQPRNVQEAQRQQLAAVVGDATSAEVWRQVHLPVARAVAVTVPDHDTAIQVIHRAKSIAPHVPVIVRARDHVFLQDMTAAGALAVVDEEHLAGRRLGREVSRRLRLEPSSAETADDPPVT